MQVSIDVSGDPSRCCNDACARARAHDDIEVINLRAQRRSTSELPVTSYLSIRMLVRISLFEYLEYHINGIVYHGFMLSFRLHIRRVNRTTCPATLIVAWLVNLYIEDLFDINRHSNFVTILPP